MGCGRRNDEEFWIFLICFISYVFSDPNRDNLPHSIPTEGKTKRCLERRERRMPKKGGKVHATSNGLQLPTPEQHIRFRCSLKSGYLKTPGTQKTT